MMQLVHALVLTPFEAALPAKTFEELSEQDYPLHWIYCPTTGKEILLENSIDFAKYDRKFILSRFLDSSDKFI